MLADNVAPITSIISAFRLFDNAVTIGKTITNTPQLEPVRKPDQRMKLSSFVGSLCTNRCVAVSPDYSWVRRPERANAARAVARQTVDIFPQQSAAVRRTSLPFASQQLPDRLCQRFAAQVPKRCVQSPQRGHRHALAAVPSRQAVHLGPQGFNFPGIAANEHRFKLSLHDQIGQPGMSIDGSNTDLTVVGMIPFLEDQRVAHGGLGSIRNSLQALSMLITLTAKNHLSEILHKKPFVSCVTVSVRFWPILLKYSVRQDRARTRVLSFLISDGMCNFMALESASQQGYFCGI